MISIKKNNLPSVLHRKDIPRETQQFLTAHK